jgi:hypothetical protein
MPSKEERERRKRLIKEMDEAVQSVQEMRVPISKSDLHDLFNWIDKQVEDNGCDHTLRHALEFVRARRLPEEKVVTWLNEFGGYCDCEVILNVEEEWGEFADSI